MAVSLALRISVTDRCPLNCLYCRPQPMNEPRQAHDILQEADLFRFVRVARAALGVAKVRLTGGEPLVRGDIVQLVAALSRLRRTSDSCRHLGEALSCYDSTMNLIPFRFGQMLSLSISPTSHTNLRSSRLPRRTVASLA